MNDVSRHVVGVIADTHGLLRPEALQALAGCELIIHAGDVGRVEVLEGLRTIAPVLAVRGNVDRDPGPEEWPPTRTVQVGDVNLYVLHDVEQLDLNPQEAGFQAVIYGHSHKPSIGYRRGVLFLNPGAAGARRFSLPVSLARLYIHKRELRAELLTID